MTLDSSGKVGIGTTAPGDYYADNLVVACADHGGLTLASSATTHKAFLAWADGTSGSAAYQGYLAYDHNNNSLQIATAGTERVRIDASGNFIVGKTTQGLANAGFEIAQTGQATATQSGASALRLNRLTSDGEILQFRKASTTVGNIATVDGDLTIFSSASGHKGLRFGNGYIAPTSNSTTVEDNTVNLGLSSYRFKDLYLSNKVYAAYIGQTGDTDTSINFDTADTIKFVTGGSEAARINSSSDLLVGKTTASSGTAGHKFSSTGAQESTVDGGLVGYFNRLSSDGEIVRFDKDLSLIHI